MEILHQHNQRVFEQFANQKSKVLAGKHQPKILIANADAEHFTTYFDHIADIKRSFSIDHKSDYRATRIISNAEGSTFVINKKAYTILIPGHVNVSNATGAIAAALELGKAPQMIARGLAELGTIPGRMEKIDLGQDFQVIVDYAHEETGMTALMDSARSMVERGGKIITLLGAEGGGRDVKKRPVMGKIAMSGSDYIVISNVDPYNDDPATIIRDIADGAKQARGIEGKHYFCIDDRRTGIAKALSLASSGDIVLITGKGAEQSIVIGGKKTKWDDRVVVREELKKIPRKK